MIKIIIVMPDEMSQPTGAVPSPYSGRRMPLIATPSPTESNTVAPRVQTAWVPAEQERPYVNITRAGKTKLTPGLETLPMKPMMAQIEGTAAATI